MRLLRIAIAWLAVVTGSQLFALDDLAELKGIAKAERSPVWAVGKKGERGIYQMKPYNVKRYGGYDTPAALLMLHEIETELKVRGEKVNAFNVALCWKMGTHGAMDGYPSRTDYQYALDVQMTYYGLTQGR